jgi:hypothetical protein
MIKTITFILLLLTFGCHYTNLSSYNLKDDFAGMWVAENNRDAVLKIYPKSNQTYLLKFDSGNYQWEGIGYQFADKIIAVFRYKNVYDQGYVTFTLENYKRLRYVSMNPDGSERVRGIYIKK